MENLKLWYPRKHQKKDSVREADIIKTRVVIKLKKPRYLCENPGYYANATTIRYFRLTKNAPLWLNDIQLKEIREMYLLSALKKLATGIKHEVDHIDPINGKSSRGLHVPWNLRVVTMKENRLKKITNHSLFEIAAMRTPSQI